MKRLQVITIGDRSFHHTKTFCLSDTPNVVVFSIGERSFPNIENIQMECKFRVELISYSRFLCLWECFFTSSKNISLICLFISNNWIWLLFSTVLSHVRRDGSTYFKAFSRKNKRTPYSNKRRCSGCGRNAYCPWFIALTLDLRYRLNQLQAYPRAYKCATRRGYLPLHSFALYWGRIWKSYESSRRRGVNRPTERGTTARSSLVSLV